MPQRFQAERDHRRKEASDAIRRHIAEALKEKEDLVKVGRPTFEDASQSRIALCLFKLLDFLSFTHVT